MRLAVLSLLCLSGLAAARFQGAFSSALSAHASRKAQEVPAPTNCADALTQTVVCAVENGLSGACCAYSDAAVTYCGNGTIGGYVATFLTAAAEGLLPISQVPNLFSLLGDCPGNGNYPAGCENALSSACNCLNNNAIGGNYQACGNEVAAQINQCVGSELGFDYFDYIAVQSAISNVPGFGADICVISVAAAGTCIVQNPPNGTDFNATVSNCADIITYADRLCAGVNLNSTDLMQLAGLSQQTQEYASVIVPEISAALNAQLASFDYIGPGNFCPMIGSGSGSNGGGSGGGGSNNGQCDYSAVAEGVYWYNGMYVSADPQITTGEYAYTLYGQNFFYLPESSTYQLTPAFQCA